MQTAMKESGLAGETCMAGSTAFLGQKENELPALGRPLHLGTLYDRRSDIIIPGITLWDSETLQKNVCRKPQLKTELCVLASDHYDDLASALNLTWPLRASLLGGKIELNGSARYLKDRRKSRSQARVVLHYFTTTHFEQLTMSHLERRNISYPDVFDQSEATHVVTAVLYGAQAFFVFDREVATAVHKQTAEGELRDTLQALTNQGKGAEGSTNTQHNSKANLENFSCTFYGDIALENNPVTDSDVMRIYTSLPKLLGENGEKAVPIKVWLHPLAELDQRAAQLVRQISADLITRAQAAIEQLGDCGMQCQDLARSTDGTAFPVMVEKLLHFQGLCKRYKEAFQEQLAGVLPSIRGGGQEEKLLRDILARKEQSPFNPECLTQFMKEASAEMDFVKLCCSSLKDVDIIPSEYKLKEVLFDQKCKFVLSFTFTSLQREEPYLLALEEWIRKTSDQAVPGPAYEQPKSKQWFEEEKLTGKTREYVTCFSEFASLNRPDGKMSFILSSVPDKDHPGVSLYLYEDGELISRNFGPLLQPLPPGIGEIRHDSVQLTFDHAEGGRALISSYHLKFRVLGQETWTALDIKNAEETFLVRKLLPSTQYQFRYAVRSKVGLGESSGESEVVKTLPTSPPRKPRVTIVESSAVSLTWTSPEVLGEGAVIAEYKVTCQEDTEGGPNGKEEWKGVPAGRGDLRCRVAGLRPGTPYRVWVLAVTSEGTESAPSEETVCTTLTPDWPFKDMSLSKGKDAPAIGTTAFPVTEENELPALGRPLHLGTLYDWRSDTFLSGITLWDLVTSQKHVCRNPSPKTEAHILASDHYDDLASVLNLTWPLRASLLGGKIELNGSARYLKDRRKSRSQARVVLHCYTTTHFEELTVPQNISYPEVFEQGKATHVVTAVLYGAQAFFVFDREVATAEHKQTVEGELRDTLQALTNQGKGVEGSTNIRHNSLANLENFSCTFYGDIALENNPVTDSDVMRIYTSLPKLLGENGEKAVPIKVWLHPLAELDQRAAQLVRQISADLITRAQAAIEQLGDCGMQCQDLARSTDGTAFPVMVEKLLHFQGLCKRYKEAFQEQLAGVLPSIRGGGQEEELLRDILARKEQSPFNPECLTQFLKDMSAEMDFVKLCCSSLKDAEIIPSENKLKKVLSDHRCKFVLSFTFTSLQREEPYLLALEEWIRKTSDQAVPGPAYEQPKSKQWFEEEKLTGKAREYMKSFSEFASLNRQDSNVCFIVSLFQDRDNRGVSLYVYEDGQLVSRNFVLPSKRSPPVIDEIGHDCVQLTLDPVDSGRALMSSYCVEYRTLDQETWTALDTKNTEETFLVRKLCPNTQYQFRYAVRSKVGLGESSRESKVVKTLPTSPPRKPQVTTAGAFAVFVTWKSPSVIGKGVVITEFKVKYKEEAAEGSKRRKDKWKEVLVGKNSLPCQMTGLKSGVLYKFQVLAVSSEGTESAPSEETVITALRTGDISQPRIVSEPELRIVLIGRTGSGKSATGNTILRMEEFPSAVSAFSVTSECQKRETIIQGRKITIVDTPSFFHTSTTHAFTWKDLETCIKRLYPGPHAIIFVTKVGKMVKEEQKVIQHVRRFFRAEGKSFLIVLFTHKDKLESEGLTLKAFLDCAHSELRDLLAMSEERCIAFNNKANGEERSQQVTKLIEMIDSLVSRNTEKVCYTEELFRKDA